MVPCLQQHSSGSSKVDAAGIAATNRWARGACGCRMLLWLCKRFRETLSFRFNMLPECADCLAKPCKYTHLHIGGRGSYGGHHAYAGNRQASATAVPGSPLTCPLSLGPGAALLQLVRQPGMLSNTWTARAGALTSTPCVCTHSKPCSPPRHPACTEQGQCSAQRYHHRQMLPRCVHTLGSRECSSLDTQLFESQSHELGPLV